MINEHCTHMAHVPNCLAFMLYHLQSARLLHQQRTHDTVGLAVIAQHCLQVRTAAALWTGSPDITFCIWQKEQMLTFCTLQGVIARCMQRLEFCLGRITSKSRSSLGASAAQLIMPWCCHSTRAGIWWARGHATSFCIRLAWNLTAHIIFACS